MTETVQTAVVGVTGYSGAELARLLLHHPRLRSKPPVFAGRIDAGEAARGGTPLGEIHPELADSNGSGKLRLQPFSWDLLADLDVEVLFLATPHEQSRAWVPEALARGHARHRPERRMAAERSRQSRRVQLRRRGLHRRRCNVQAQAVYGMPELHRAKIAERAAGC